MPYRNTKTGYGSIARLLHWVMAICIFSLFGMGGVIGPEDVVLSFVAEAIRQ